MAAIKLLTFKKMADTRRPQSTVIVLHLGTNEKTRNQPDIVSHVSNIITTAQKSVWLKRDVVQGHNTFHNPITAYFVPRMRLVFAGARTCITIRVSTRAAASRARNVSAPWSFPFDSAPPRIEPWKGKATPTPRPRRGHLVRGGVERESQSLSSVLPLLCD